MTVRTGEGLPVPQRGRWQPLRAGLVDIFYYDYQEFWFRDGRLMLLGNNGTGKSKVLALTLPFLLDANLSPTRVEPDGDRNKKMEWNLLLGGKYDERLGYIWLEFGRRTDDGEHAYFTIGCGLKAAAGRGIASHWYFTTSQRIGADLFLIGPAGAALTKDRLTAAVGEYGMVTEQAEAYRRVVDEHLLHLGPDRYGSLVDLLIQLRQPQLSKRPDEGKLSKALSEALAPLDQSVIADIAAAFHDLEQQREELSALKDTRGHIARFSQRYQLYARVAARRQSRELRTAQYSYEETGRQLGGVRDEIEAARTAEAQATERLAAVDDQLTDFTAARDELAGRPELASLEQAERLAGETAQTAAREKDKESSAERAVVSRSGNHDTARAEAGRTRELVTSAAAAARDAAARAGLDREHDAAAGTLELPDGIAEQLTRAADRDFAAMAARREAAVAHVITLAAHAAEAEGKAAAERSKLAELEAERDAAADERQAAEDAVHAAAGSLVAAWHQYAARTTELDAPHPDEAGLLEWAATLDGPNPAETALRAAASHATQELAAEHARRSARAEEAAAALETLEEERRRLEAGETRRPPAPYTRGEGVRDGRPGAPLWRVTNFADGLDEVNRAGLEAALEASGLLDAWVTPEGALVDRATHDVILGPGTPAPGHPAAPRASLLSVLRPVIDQSDPAASQLSSSTVTAILAAIGLDPSPPPGPARPEPASPHPAIGTQCRVWLSGRWQVGPLRGAWAKDAAEYIGAATREQAKRRRLAALAEEIAAAEDARQVAQQAVTDIEARQALLQAEAAAYPGDQGLRDAHGKAAGARAALERATGKAAEQAIRAAGARRAAEDAAAERDSAAADLSLPAGLDQLRAAEKAVRDYADLAQRLVSALWQHQAKLTDVATCAAELAKAEQDRTAAQELAAEAARVARQEAARLAALRSTIGSTADQVRQKLDQVKRRIAELERGRHHLAEVLRDQSERRARLQGRAEQLQDNLAAEAVRRDAAVAAFWRFAATGLLAVAVEVPEADVGPVGDGVTPAVRLARRVEQELASTDDGDDAWRRVQDDIGRRHAELAEALSRHGHHSTLSLVDERVVITIGFQGKDRTPDELTGLLSDEISYRERLLTAKERELIEEHLVSHVASHLQELISDAEAQVEQMNAELAERPTSTGMRLRLGWEPAPDAPAGLPEARRRLLRQDAELWSPDDRAAVGEFLHRQIEVQRASSEDATWQEQLRLALDYRSWHRFVIERFSDGRWRSATGPASGGERVLTVSLPLFAAASAHYRSAHPDAPRLVLLDEAFAGVDDDSRAKCLGLLANFDLDVVMTSEREWGFYATVPGIATHQLVRRDGIDAVHVTVWEWDGRSHRRVERRSDGHGPAAELQHERV
jgi:uncharacterized protein (TIGR02680 family)